MTLLFSDFCFCFLMFKFQKFNWSKPNFSDEWLILGGESVKYQCNCYINFQGSYFYQ